MLCSSQPAIILGVGVKLVTTSLYLFSWYLGVWFTTKIRFKIRQDPLRSFWIRWDTVRYVEIRFGEFCTVFSIVKIRRDTIRYVEIRQNTHVSAYPSNIH